MKYFNDDESMQYRYGNNMQGTIEKIANMYIGKNPALPFVFRCFSKQGIQQLEDGRYDINLGLKFPDARSDQYAYAFGKIWSDSERSLEAVLSCYGPTRIYLNGRMLFKSGVVEEVNINNRKVLGITLEKGWNGFFISMRKVASGFGCIFGSNRSGLNLMDFMAPFTERFGYGGWIYSEPVEKEMFWEGNIPDLCSVEQETGLRWYPDRVWSDHDLTKKPCARIFGVRPGKYAYAWSKINSTMVGVKKYTFESSFAGPAAVWIDGVKQFCSNEADNVKFECFLEFGQHDILVETASGERDWGFIAKVQCGENTCEFHQPYPVKGINDPWLYIGPFCNPLDGAPQDIQTVYRLFEDREEGHIYWRIDRPDTWVRPYVENPLFARWNYPLGVTLYGLLQTGRMLGRQDMVDYVIHHISECTHMYPYSIWDAEQYGYPSVNQKLVELKLLDDCGSIGSAMLETYSEAKDDSYLHVADVIADYMKSRQERQEDGAFYRDCKGYFMENTLWADDLYMSTPFLIRYYKLTGKKECIDDAARQFLLFKKYLFIPEQKLMSHVYDFKYGTATYIPWGRGNGWPLFSLSEVLEVLPEDHGDRAALLDFFNEFCEGVLALQGENGLWHQVLTHPGSYEETSCTAMFCYAFARGVRFGWLKEKETYIQAVFRAWGGLAGRSIDSFGNVHGVCWGSRYSFTPEYYKDELLWSTNDTHGIGIVLLAGIEITKLEKFLKKA